MDREIHDLIEPLLYENGRGKLVPLSRIWQARFGKVTEEGKDEGDASSSDQNSSRADMYRWVCWKLEERGHVGETALHICFLLSTPSHMILAKKLLAMFPMLINDLYHCDQYFGESSLVSNSASGAVRIGRTISDIQSQHMAIVNEDVRIVKLLLDHGANVHERCLGSFFLPNDQKDKANGFVRRFLLSSDQKIAGKSDFETLDLLSNQFNSISTNYDG